MSKRVSNKSTKCRKGRYARSKVSYGWKKMRLFGIFGKDKVLSGEYLKEANSE
jgi:hypothetical protein